MELLLLNGVPGVLLGIGFVFVVVGVSVGGLMLVRRSVSLSTLESHNDVAGFMIAVIGVLYGVLLAFIVINVWENFNDADKVADDEAGLVLSLYRDTGVLSGDRSQLRADLRSYARSVVDDEWDEMAEDQQGSRRTDVALDRLWRSYARFDPTTSSDSVFYANSVDRLEKLAEARSTRILRSSGHIGGTAWVVLWLGAGILIGFSYLFAVQRTMAQVLMVVALSGIGALTLFLALALGFRVSGEYRVAPSGMRDVLQLMPPPDATGQPSGR